MSHLDTEIISTLRIGVVTAVRGRKVEITVDAEKNDFTLLYKGKIVTNVSVGSYLIIRRGYRHLVVQVEEEELSEAHGWHRENYQRDIDRNIRFLSAIMIGEIQLGKFKLGSSTTPLIGNVAYIAENDDVLALFSNTETSDLSERSSIRLGKLFSRPATEYRLDSTKLFASHIGIFGNTGSGKSYTLTQLYTRLIALLPEQEDLNKHTHFLFFDLNGEYSEPSSSTICNPNRKSIYTLNPPLAAFSQGDTGAENNENSRIPLPLETLHEADFWFTVLEATEKTQRPFITRALKRRMREISSIKDECLDILQQLFQTNSIQDRERTLPFTFLDETHSLLYGYDNKFQIALEEAQEKISFQSIHKKYFFTDSCYGGSGKSYADDSDFQSRVKTMFNTLFNLGIEKQQTELQTILIKFHLQYYSEIAKGFANIAHIRPLIARLRSRTNLLDKSFSFEEQNQSTKLVTVINLQYASLEERKIIPLIITRAIYRQHKSRQDGKNYLNIIIDEAHNLLSYESSQESEVWRNTRLETFEEILKEGRKFGVFVTLASQRPYDISPTITSQLHHFFLHRLVNPKDIDAIRNAVSYLDRKSFEGLPMLPTGTCIVSGTSIQLPTLVQVDKLADDQRPRNETIDLKTHWWTSSLI
jgi:hypothetical protein